MKSDNRGASRFLMILTLGFMAGVWFDLAVNRFVGPPEVISPSIYTLTIASVIVSVLGACSVAYYQGRIDCAKALLAEVERQKKEQENR